MAWCCHHFRTYYTRFVQNVMHTLWFLFREHLWRLVANHSSVVWLCGNNTIESVTILDEPQMFMEKMLTVSLHTDFTMQISYSSLATTMKP
jgi:hypothetical protein